MDARLDTLSKRLCQVNVHVSRIARWQVIMSDFAPKTSLPPHLVASDSEDKDDDDGYDDDVYNGDASSTNEMFT